MKTPLIHIFTMPPKTVASGAPCERLNVLLDIDETLVYYISGKVRAHSWDKLAPAEQAKYNFSAKSPTSGVLILRPHVREFLSYLFQYCNVSLWTMSEREYAEDIAGVLLKLFKKRTPNQTFQHLFSSDDDDEHDVAAADLNGCNKDLNWLWYTYAKKYPCFSECNTILIDDLPANAVNKSNRQNAIKIAPFALFGEVKARTDPYEDVSEDDVLPQLIAILKKVRAAQKNCYNDPDRREYSVFSDRSVKQMGLEQYYLPQEWKREKFNSVTVNRTKSASPSAAAAAPDPSTSAQPKKKSSAKSLASVPSSPSPPKPTAKCERMNVILDIDETLLYFISGKVRGHSWDKLSPAEQAKYEYSTKGPTAAVMILRPHVRKFLAFLFRNFNVSLWTMSEREYAEDIASGLLTRLKTHKPNHKYKFAHLFSADDDEDHAVAAGDLNGNNKDLNWLWYKYAKDYPCFAECNTILIDDLPANAVNNSNRHNAIKIAPFALFGEVKARTDPYEDVSRDDVLLQLIEILKKVRDHQKNCYNDDVARWKWVFRASNVKQMGLQKYYLPQEWKGEKFNSMTVNSTKAVSHVTHVGGTSPRSTPSADMDKLIKKIVKHLPNDLLGVVDKLHSFKNPLMHPSKEQIRSMVHENKETVLGGWSPFFDFNGKKYKTLTAYKRSAGVMLRFELYEIDAGLEKRRLNGEFNNLSLNPAFAAGWNIWPHPLIAKASMFDTLRVTVAANDIAAEQYFVAALAIRMRYLGLDTPEVLNNAVYVMDTTQGEAFDQTPANRGPPVYWVKPFKERVIELFQDENNLKIIQDMYMKANR